MLSFSDKLKSANLEVTPTGMTILQVNLTKLCNQACRHCHVDSSPKRREMLSRENIERCLTILRSHPEVKILDITGGAPELHADFEFFVSEARKLGKEVMVRHNLTVTHDPHPVTGASMAHLPDFFLKQRVQVVSSLPYYDKYFTDKQRGNGVFEKSILSLKLLNDRGFGVDGTGLLLNLVYNPVGTFLPPEQKALEAKYKEALKAKFNVSFNSLFTITNMPIKRFSEDLKRLGQYEEYMEKLSAAFNPSAALGVMCRDMISVDHDGNFYDCDFNQMLGMKIDGSCASQNLASFDLKNLLERKIVFANHCYGCTAGAGSSCGGATA